MSDPEFSTKDILNFGAAALKAGDLPKAANHFANVLLKMPAHSGAKTALKKIHKARGSGKSLTQADVDHLVSLLQSGQFEDAAGQAVVLMQIASKEALLPNILGMALASSGRMSAAVSAYKQAVKLNPNYPEALGNLGSGLLELGAAKDAIRYLDKAVKLKPDLTEALNSLGNAHAILGQFDHSVQAFDRALEINPSYVNALNGKGALLKNGGQYPQAIKLYEKALSVEPNNVDVLTNYGYILAVDDQEEAAILQLEKALILAPDRADVHYRLGVQLGHLGKTEKSVAHLKMAVTLQADFAQAYRSLSEQIKFSQAEPLIATMEDLIASDGASPEMRLHLGFALGKAHEDCGNYKTAFSYFNIGNFEKRQTLAYSHAEAAQQFSTLKQTFTPDLIKRIKTKDPRAEKMIFVLGMNRSGTSLVEQILASHDDVFGAGELDTVTQYLFANIRRFADIQADELAEFARSYLDAISEMAQGQRYFIDKLPSNYHAIGLIKAAFPAAKIIQLDRDPRDNCLSIFKTHFETQAHAYGYDLQELARYFELYVDLMAHWNQMFAGEIYTCSYENLIANQEQASRKLLEYCGLPWQAQVLDFHKTKRVVKTASVSQVRQKIYSGSVGSWQNYSAELEPLIKALQDGGLLSGDAAR